MHEKNICHRDLKPANILITKNYDIRICDFGEAKLIDEIENDPSKQDNTRDPTPSKFNLPS